MNNRKTAYRTPLMFCIALLAIFICCAAFIGCPEAEEMTDGVITLPEEIPPPPPEDRPPLPGDGPPPPPPPEDG
jgi:hypothetical protein